MNFSKMVVTFCLFLSFIVIHVVDAQVRGPKGAKKSPVSTRSPEFTRSPEATRSRESTLSNVYGPTTKADTLWQISLRYSQNKPFSVYQTMTAIYQANSQAFEKDNINSLKNGAILQIPTDRYINGVDPQQAKSQAEQDVQDWQPADGSSRAGKPKKKTDLDQAKEILEAKLGAIDEAQNKQFTAIRRQFAESISSQQMFLDENKKLLDWADKVNQELNNMRSQGEQSSVEINQIGLSVEELLAQSRKERALEEALKEQSEASWLDDPISIILLSMLPVLLLLAGVAIWLIRRKGTNTLDAVDIMLDEDVPLDKHASEMDDLSDALSAELSGEDADADVDALDALDELDDDNLFGEDESLGDELGDDFDEPADQGPEIFDNLDEDSLEDALDDEFEEGSEVVEQDDLDNLFAEDDELLAEVHDESLLASMEEPAPDNDLLIDSDNDELDDLLAEHAPVSEDLPDDNEAAAQAPLEIDPIDEILAQAATATQAPLEIDPIDEILAQAAATAEEPTEVDIDDLLEQTLEQPLENTLLGDSQEINEELLQDLDKEIAAKNEQLDNVTSSLIEELEQVEQMRNMPPDDNIEGTQQRQSADTQIGIQKLDELAEDIEPDLLAEDFTELDEDEALTDTDELADLAADGTTDIDQLLDSVNDFQQEPPISENLATDIEEVEQAPELKNIETNTETETAENEVPTQSAQPDETTKVSDDVVDLDDIPELGAEPALDENAQVSDDAVDLDDIPELGAAHAPQTEPALDETTDVSEALHDKPEFSAQHTPIVEDIGAAAEAATDLQSIDPELAELQEPSELSTDEMPAEDQSTEVDPLEQALEDFENEPLGPLAGSQSSGQTASISDSDDLELGASKDNFGLTNSQGDTAPADPPSVDDSDSIDDFDDAALEQALGELSEDLVEAPLDTQNPSQPEPDNKDAPLDMPGLGDWLTDTDSPSPLVENADNDLELLNELEDSSFDEMLESLDLPDTDPADQDFSGMDIAALLDESPVLSNQQQELTQSSSEEGALDIAALLNESPELSHQQPDLEQAASEDDFLEVATLLDESMDAESDEKALDLNLALEPFVNDGTSLDMIDVDADDGLGAKLDLAQAYVEMGEQNSARELLESVLEKGNEKQISEAKEILNKLL